MEKQTDKEQRKRYNNIKQINKDIRSGKIKNGETVILDERKQSQKGMIKIEDVEKMIDERIDNLNAYINNPYNKRKNQEISKIKLEENKRFKQSLKESGEKNETRTKITIKEN